MAKNQRFFSSRKFSLACTDPASPASGAPVLVGQLPGVALTTMDANGNTSIDTEGVYDLSVKGVTTAGAGSAVAVGDIIYYVPANTPKLSKAVNDAGAVRYGNALGTVLSTATTTIPVRLGY